MLSFVNEVDVFDRWQNKNKQYTQTHTHIYIYDDDDAAATLTLIAETIAMLLVVGAIIFDS